MVDRGRSGGAPLTHGGADRGHGGALIRAWPPAAPVSQRSPMGVQKRERSTGSSVRASLELGRRCSDQAMAVQNREAALAFYTGSGERRGGVARAVNTGVNGFNAVEDGSA
jgi:hypothetical protein